MKRQSFHQQCVQLLFSKAEVPSKQTEKIPSSVHLHTVHQETLQVLSDLKQQSSDTELVCKNMSNWKLSGFSLSLAAQASIHPGENSTYTQEPTSATAAGLWDALQGSWGLGMPRDRQQAGAGRERLWERRKENLQICSFQTLPSSPFRKEITRGFPVFCCMHQYFDSGLMIPQF